MSTKTAFCWVVVLSIISSVGFSQEDKGYFDFNEPVPPTPNVASLGKYGDIPVSLHTGVPNISIPIYTITEGDISLDVSLSYHSSGVRVDEIASWVGLGWSLNAGGMITQSVMGAPDQGHKAISKGLSSISGHGWYRDYGMPEEINNCRTTPSDPTDQGCATCSCAYYFGDAANGLVDTEPDIFSYSVNGISGKFYFDENRNVILRPINDVKVIIDYDETSDEFIGWTVIGPDGTQYIFGGSGATEKTYSSPVGFPGANPDYHTSTSWYLTHIISANRKDSINLQYESERYGYGNRVSQTVSVNASNCNLSGDVGKAPDYLLVNSVDGVRLKRITSNSGYYTVDFVAGQLREDLHKFESQFLPNDEAKSLSQVVVQFGNFSKTWDLEMDYFVSDPLSGQPNNTSPYTLGFDLKRLKLNSVSEQSSNGSVLIPPHQFVYNSTPLPRRYSLARDHWGYYNGATQNQNWIPSTEYYCLTQQFNYGSAQREPNESYMDAGVLEEVIYPTGGKTRFFYEGHRLGNDLVGGLRLIRQESFTENGDLALFKDYSYLNPRLFSNTISYLNDPQNSYWGSVYGVAFNQTITSSPKPALQSTQGYHIGYGKVIVTHPDGGHDIQTFNNQTQATAGFSYPTPPPVSVIGGAALIQTEYLTDQDMEVYRKRNVYGTSNRGYLTATRVITHCPTSGPCGTTPFVFYSDYSLSSSRHRISQEIEVRDGIESVTDYSYSSIPPHDNPVEIKSINSQGEEMKSVLTYPLDAPALVPTDMIIRNMISIPVISEQYNNELRVSRTQNFFELENDMILLKKMEVLPQGKESGKVSLDLTYDLEGNVTEQQKSDDIPTSYIWGLNKTRMVASVVNASENEIYYQGFESSQAANLVAGKTGKHAHGQDFFIIPVEDRPQGVDLVMTFWYKSGGEWNYQDEIPYSDTVSKPGAEALDEIRVYPLQSQMTTYIYDPGGVLVAQGDPNGQITYYEYDELSRLKIIKDHNEDILQTTSYHYFQN